MNRIDLEQYEIEASQTQSLSRYGNLIDDQSLSEALQLQMLTAIFEVMKACIELHFDVNVVAAHLQTLCTQQPCSNIRTKTVRKSRMENDNGR